MAMCKGTAVLAVLEYFEKTRGKDGLSRLLNALEAPDQAVFSAPIINVSWIDYGAYLRLLLAADRFFGTGDGQIINQAMYYQARKDLGGIYSFFVRVASPHFVIGKAASLWRQYYNQGKVEILTESKNLVEFKVTDFPDIPLRHEVENLPYFEEVARICNCKNPRATHPKCLARGDDCCHFAVKWS